MTVFQRLLVWKNLLIWYYNLLPKVMQYVAYGHFRPQQSPYLCKANGIKDWADVFSSNKVSEKCEYIVTKYSAEIVGRFVIVTKFPLML